MPRTVILDNSRLAAAARNSAVVAEFPFLAAGRPVRRPGCCSGGGSGDTMAAAKAGVAGLSPKRVEVLKRLLHADVLVVYVGTGSAVEKVVL